MQLFDKISFYILLTTISLLPIFFIPLLGIDAETAKLHLLVLGVGLAFVSWLIARLVGGTVSFPKHIISGLLGLFLLWVLIASFFSSSPYMSFIGHSFNIGTFISLATLSILFFLSAEYFRDRERLSYLYFFLIAGFAVALIFEIVFVAVGPAHLSLGTFFTRADTIVGKLNDFAIYGSILGILGVLSYELFRPRKPLRFYALGVSILGVLILLATNFVLGWVIFAIGCLSIFVYSLSFGKKDLGNHFPAVSFSALLVSLLFIIGNASIGGFIPGKIGFSNTEIRPSLSATLSVAKDTLLANPIIGTGPNQFQNAWAHYKPESLNLTVFWDVLFSSGFGYVPTMMVTLGAVGGLLLIIISAYILISVIRRVFLADASGQGRKDYVLASSFFAAVSLFIYFWIYTPGIVIVAFTFVFLGIAVAELAEKKKNFKTWNFLKDPRHSFFSILGSIVILIAVLFGLYVTSKKTVALVTYARANIAMAENNVDETVRLLAKTAALDHDPLYYRILSQIYLNKLLNLFTVNNLPEETLKSEFQANFQKAEGFARAAVVQEPGNVENYVNLGNMYRAIVSFEVPNAFENAKGSYEKALELSPRNPGIDLLLARLSVDHKDTESARLYINSAFSKKPNYTDAIFLLAQIEVSDGNIANAISEVEQAALIEPNSSAVFFELGILKYNNKDYEGARIALERAVTLNKEYLNARYFLGLTYEKLGRVADERVQFSYIHEKLPDNQDIRAILSNIDQGLPAIPETTTPPEDNPDLPVPETE